MEVSHLNILHGRYRLFYRWWKSCKRTPASKSRDREVNVEVLVIGILTCSTIIVHVEQRLFNDDALFSRQASYLALFQLLACCSCKVNTYPEMSWIHT